MEAGGEEDPFGSLIKLCQISSSQESKLHDCPFALESENFPDAVDSLPSQFSPAPTPSDPPGIIMLSPPESDGGDEDEGEDEDEDEDEDGVPIDKSTPQENEEFQTRPEHHNISASSSQEEPQQPLKPITGVDERIDGSDATETVAIDDGHGENEVNFDFGKRGENLGFSETEELEGEVQGIEGFESELGERRSKKIKIYEENWDSETQTVLIDETENREEIDDEEQEELIYLDVDEIDEGMVLDEQKVVIHLDSAEPEANGGVSKNGGMQEKISNGDNDSEGETEKVYCGSDGGVGNPGEKEDDGENNVMINGRLVTEGYEEGIRENGIAELRENGEEVYGCRNIQEIEKFKYKGRSGLHSPRKEKDVSLGGSERSSLINRDSVVQASAKGARSKGNDQVRKSGKEVYGCRSIEEIEQFRYKGSADGGDECWKEVTRRKRELPLSLKEKGNDVGEKERVSKLDAKNLSWKELLDAVAVVLGPVNYGSEDVDVLEAAKRKGMIFPHPRWI